MSKLLRGTVAIAAVAAFGFVTQLPAQAVHDNTAPVLHTPLKAHFVNGTQLDEYTVDGFYFYNVPQVIDWNASDDSGALYYEVWEYLAGSEPELLVDFTEDSEATVNSTDYDSQFGGGSFATTNWSVAARDFSGNTTARAVYGAYLTVTQQDGTQTREHETDDVSLTYTGNWKKSSCVCFAAGTARKTSQLRATAAIHVNVTADEGGRAVALVMETAPNRGRAQIYVDGVYRGTIDTFAATAKHRTVVWNGLLGVGSHTVEVVNLATAGRPRIDIDAVVVN